MIPVCVPLLSGNEKKYLMDAIATNWISSSGKYIGMFEEAFAKYCGVEHGICVTNGTHALHLALVALGIGKGDEVIVPDFTMIASAFAVCYTGAVPVFVDADKDTWNMDVSKIEERINSKTKAIMAVHIYGNPCDMHSINKIARKYNLKVIEDAAEVHVAEYGGKKCGALGDISCFSFFANKIITTGEGGMVLTNDLELAKRCRYYQNLCFSVDGPRDYVHHDIGFNYRMSNLHAAIGLAQTEKAEEYVLMRIKTNKLYRELLGGIDGISFQVDDSKSRNVYWMNGILIDKEKFGVSRDELMEKLKVKGVDSRPFFVGMHKQPSLIKYGCRVDGDFSVSEYLGFNGLYIPSGSGLKEEEIRFVCDRIK